MVSAVTSTSFDAASWLREHERRVRIAASATIAAALGNAAGAMRDRIDAVVDDIVQELCERAWMRGGELARTDGTNRGYVAQSARNEARDWLRDLRRYEYDAPHADDHDGERVFNAGPAHDPIDALLDELETERQARNLRALLDAVRLYAPLAVAAREAADPALARRLAHPTWRAVMRRLLDSVNLPLRLLGERDPDPGAAEEARRLAAELGAPLQRVQNRRAEALALLRTILADDIELLRRALRAHVFTDVGVPHA